MAERAYEIRVVGILGKAARQAFAGMVIEVEPAASVLAGRMDQSSLHELLDRVRALGLDLIDVRQGLSPVTDGQAVQMP